MSSAGTRLSSIAGKSFRVLALLLLLLVGWIAIGGLHLFITWHNAPVTPLGSGLVTTRSWDRGFVTAEGTWTIDGEKHAFPINMSKISCAAGMVLGPSPPAKKATARLTQNLKMRRLCASGSASFQSIA
jgi:hypothetical protein